MVNQSRKAGLGRTLIKAQKFANQRRNPRKTTKHTTEIIEPISNRVDLKSVTAQTNLDEFFEEAELAGKQFVTEKRNVSIVHDDKTSTNLYTQDERAPKNNQIELDDIEIEKTLSVPRRPKWDATTTPEQLEETEKMTFLAWRRKLARLQEMENVTLTPFEKNLEIWRQLWRVIERSDIVVQILDCRNPLLYLCDDLIKYVNEAFDGKKSNLILLNKADYLTSEQRRMWADYFKNRGIKFIFFSALIENEKLKTGTRRESETENRNDDDDRDTDSDEDSRFDSESVSEEMADKLESNLKLDGRGDENNQASEEVEDELKIYNKFELLDTWYELLKNLETTRNARSDSKSEPEVREPTRVKMPDDKSESSSSHARPLTVGLVGYPNVGKSSTINALLSAKRVAVSATPGKTKHFQTFLVDRDMMLCDCPGLVFPNFVSCKSEMVINGVLPIDQMKDHITPVKLIVDKVPRGYFEDLYGLAFDYDIHQNITAEDLLNAFGYMRGYMTQRGLPDTSRASRVICKDYIKGKILYCEPPPNSDRKYYYSNSKLADAMKRIESRKLDPRYALRMTERQRKLMKYAKGTQMSSRDFDSQYFQANSGGAHIKGLPGIGNMTQPIGKYTDTKAPKHEKKHKKREKLRRVFRHLDD